MEAQLELRRVAGFTTQVYSIWEHARFSTVKPWAGLALPAALECLLTHLLEPMAPAELPEAGRY